MWVTGSITSFIYLPKRESYHLISLSLSIYQWCNRNFAHIYKLKKSIDQLQFNLVFVQVIINAFDLWFLPRNVCLVVSRNWPQSTITSLFKLTNLLTTTIVTFFVLVSFFSPLHSYKCDVFLRAPTKLPKIKKKASKISHFSDLFAFDLTNWS